MPPTDKDGSNEGVRELISLGSDIAGAATGAAIGFLIGGPAGGIVGAALVGGAGAAVKDVLKNVGEEISERVLGPREKVRVGGTLAICATEIRKRMDAGQKLRDDGFFTPTTSGRSPADEVAESLLLKAQREAEERKLPYMGRLLASIAFDTSISPAMAHQLIKIAEHLTYRQLCLLRLAAVKDQFSLRQTDYRTFNGFDMHLIQLLYECADLYYHSLVNFGAGALLGLTDVIPGKMMPQGFGAALFNLMRLADMPDADLLPLIAQLQR